MPRQKNPIPIAAPIGGIVENNPYASVAGPVIVRTDHVLNTRPHDSIEKRERPGSRTGINKYIDDPVDGSNPIQNINSVVEAFDPAQVVPDQQLVNKDFSLLADGDFTTLDTDFLGYTASFAAVENATDKPVVISGAVGNNPPSANPTAEAVYQPGLSLGPAYIVRWKAKHLTATGEHNFYVRVNKADPVANRTKYSFRVVGVVGVYRAQLLRHDPGVTILVDIDVDSLISDNTFHEFEGRVVGDDFTMLIDNSLVFTVLSESAHSGQSGLGFGVYEAGGLTTFTENFRVFTGKVPASLRTTSIIVVSGGTIRTGDKATGYETPANGTAALKDSGLVASQPAFQDVFFATGRAADYKYLDITTNTVLDWSTAVTAGALPVGTVDPTQACRIMALYRGRVCLSGLPETPENWFLSKSGDPFDWDFSPPVTSRIQAVAGNASDVGLLGDICTALIPFTDDLMIMGGDHTLWVMRGDPASGGQIDSISRQIGIVGRHAWSWDTGSTLYFLGQNGLYRMSAGQSTPDLLTSKKLDALFSELDLSNFSPFVIYDRIWQGVHIFLSPLNIQTTPNNHFWWDQRTDSWWRDQYPVNIGPTFAHLFDADLPDDRAILMGGFDSFLRFFEDAAVDDDGVAVDSLCRFPLIHPNMPQGQFQMDDLQISLDANGNGVLFEVFRGQTPEACAVSTSAAFSKSLVAGRNLPIRKRLRANALQYQIRNNTLGERWAYENGTVVIYGVGRQRARL